MNTRTKRTFSVAVCILFLFVTFASLFYIVKEENHQYQADDCDYAGVGQEIGKSIMQSRSDNDIWRIAAHRGRTTKVRTEDFCDNDRNRIKLQ